MHVGKIKYRGQHRAEDRANTFDRGGGAEHMTSTLDRGGSAEHMTDMMRQGALAAPERIRSKNERLSALLQCRAPSRPRGPVLRSVLITVLDLAHVHAARAPGLARSKKGRLSALLKCRAPSRSAAQSSVH